MAQTIYVSVIRELVNKRLPDKSLPDKLANNLEQVGIDTYELDIIAENISDEYIRYFHAVRSGNQALSDIPDTYIDERIVNAALKISYDDFPLIPYAYQTEEICRDAIACNPMNLEFINPELCDIALCSSAVRLNGMALEFVPVEFRTESICDQAIIDNGLAIQYLPDNHLLTQELALSAVTNNYKAFYLIPEALRSKELILVALQQYPLLYKELPIHSREITDAALFAINSLPELACYLPTALAENQDFLYLADSIHNGWQEFVGQEYKTGIQSSVV